MCSFTTKRPQSLQYTDGEGKKGDTETKETQILQEAVVETGGEDGRSSRGVGVGEEGEERRKGYSKKLLFSRSKLIKKLVIV